MAGQEHPTIQAPQILQRVTAIPLQCGQCGNRNFQLIVVPEQGRARLALVQCSRCNHRVQVDERGGVECAIKARPLPAPNGNGKR